MHAGPLLRLRVRAAGRLLRKRRTMRMLLVSGTCLLDSRSSKGTGQAGAMHVCKHLQVR
jgi:hypothetical protein